MPRKTLSIKKLIILTIEYINSQADLTIEQKTEKLSTIRDFIDFVNINKNNEIDYMQLQINKTK
jgi:hypothetical protein